MITKSIEIQETELVKNDGAFLTRLASQLGSIKNRRQLFNVINQHVRKHLNFKHSTVFVLNNDRDTIYNYFGNDSLTDSDSPFCNYKTIDRNLDLSSVDFDEISDIQQLSAYLKPDLDLPYDEGIIINLCNQESVFAHWVLISGKDQFLNRERIELTQTIANILSLALSNLRLDELMIEKDAESKTLQSLNIDFASIRDKNDLLKIIHYKLKTIFDFGYHWLAVVNEDQFTLSSFLQDSISNVEEMPCYLDAIKARYTTNDRIFNKVLLSKEPHVFDMEHLSQRGNLPEYMRILNDSGIKKTVMIGLQVGSRIIGVWAICLTENQEMSSKQLNLIKSISNPLSISVDNIIANMAISRKEAERELLLDFSYELTTVRNKVDLTRVIKNNLKNLFKFQGIMIMAAGLAEEESSVFLSNGSIEFIPGEEAEPNLLKQYFKRSIENRDIIIYQNDGAGKTEIYEMICVGLRENNYNICLFFFTPSVKENFGDHEMDLVRGISYQLSTVIANLLANEELLRREQERELLLSVNIELAAVRHHDELISIISKRLKPVLGFKHMFIGRINQEAMTAGSFLLDPASISCNHPLYADSISKSYPLNDGFINIAFEHSGAKVYDLDELGQEIELPVYLKLDYESGAKQIIASRFVKGINVFAFWIIYFDKKQIIAPDKLGLVDNLSNQLSIAASNIIANEEIREREQEKSRLLSFSNTITSVRDKNVLSKILKKQLKDLFGITDYVIHFLSDDKQKHSPVLFDADADFARCAHFKKLINNQNDIHDGIFDKILATEEPVFFDIDQCLDQAGHPDYLKSAEAIELRQMIGVSIRLGQENIAVMNFIHDNYSRIVEQYHLFKCILSQIGLTISNMMSNEKIISQLNEINNYKLQLEEEKIYLKEEIETTMNYSEIVGESEAIQKTFRLVSQVASSDCTVLILGETGTGKELIARAIHNSSPRKNKLMVKVNCAALPANLIESELFGHERGSFTGATERRLGKFELANSGTLFLDEIGEMPLELQVKLLRALQEKEIERVGGRNTIKVDVRIIAATNRDLEKEMAEGRFRSDLYYRLNIFPITLPPLRERKNDIPNLALYFIQRFAKKAGREIATLNNRALQELVNYNWPGNIRELEHLIERSILLTTGDTIKQIHLPNQTQRSLPTAVADEFVVKTLDENERDFILKTLKYCSGRVGGQNGAAQLLGVPTSTLNSRIKRLSIRKDHF
jgi:formate hydrogenlyase transcriptional activator